VVGGYEGVLVSKGGSCAVRVGASSMHRVGQSGLVEDRKIVCRTML
jgi:hypothetical protein